MATVTMTVNPQKITNSSDTNDHDLNFDTFITSPSNQGKALVDNISGPMRFNGQGVTDSSNSASYTTTDKCIIDIQKGFTFHYRGAAGSETFQISIVNEF